MMRPLFTGIAFSALVLASSLTSTATTPKAATTQPIVTAQASAPSTTAVEQATFTKINQYRASKGLPPLTTNAKITEQARAHSQAMASGRVPFSHNGFDQRVKAIATVVAYSGAAENVAYNQGYTDPASQAVQGWIKSTGHRTNIEGRYDLTGIGVAKNAKGEYYFTQIFIRRR